MPTVRELSTEDAEELAALYADYEWWEDRDVAAVRAALDETAVAISVEAGTGDDRALVAAARVLTDYVYYGMVFDVIVASDRRDEGFGETLMQAVVDHPDLQDLPGLSLMCHEGLVPFYESVGFEYYDPEMEIPEGGTEDLVRMTYQHDADEE